jgi:glycosyltransferase involved in cell wall biosynthesis
MGNTKFTIIIPTRNRAETLYWTIKTCLEQDYDNYEIIVSDNNSLDNTKEVVLSFNSDKIRYFHTEKDLSMTENFEFGLSKVSEGYLSFLGDDDGLMPHALKIANNFITETKANAIVGRNDVYVWNNFPIKQNRGVLKFDINKKNAWVDSLKQIDYVLKKTNKYLTLPCIYCTGFVSIDIINKIKLRSKGLFFLSSIPDVYSSFVIALEVGKYYFVNESFFLGGSSASSNGASFAIESSDKSIYKEFVKLNKIPYHSSVVVNKMFSSFCSESMMQIVDNHNYEYKFSKEDIVLNCLNEIKYIQSFKEFQEVKQSLLEVIKINHIDNESLIKKVYSLKFKGKSFALFYQYIRDFYPNERKSLVNIEKKVSNIYEATIINKKLGLYKGNFLYTNWISVILMVSFQKIRRFF